jgi:predicted transcriptional regulator
MLGLDHQHTADETIAAIIDPDVPLVQPNTPLEALMDIFSSSSFALISDENGVSGILTKIDILDFLSSNAG